MPVVIKNVLFHNIFVIRAFFVKYLSEANKQLVFTFFVTFWLVAKFFQELSEVPITFLSEISMHWLTHEYPCFEIIDIIVLK